MITLTTDPHGTRWTCDACGHTEVDGHEKFARRDAREHTCQREALRARRMSMTENMWASTAYPDAYRRVLCPMCGGLGRTPYQTTEHTVVCGRCVGYGYVLEALS